MIRKLLLSLVLAAPFAFAQSLPNYYPSEGFARTGFIDAIYLDESRIVINDRPFQMNSRPIVRSLSSAYDSMSKLKPGTRVAIRVDENNEIVEFWIVPANYNERRNRTGGR